MEKTNHTQLELFSQSRNQAGRNDPANYPFLGLIRAHERSILIVIAVIISGIISFTLGVERGKKISVLQNSPGLTIALTENEDQPKTNANYIPRPISELVNTAKPVAASQPAAPVKIEAIKSKDPAKQSGMEYTVQLASYQNRSAAEKEGLRLKKAGFSTLILKKTDYIILCVGNFSKREKATELLSKLKKQYPTCIIRKL